MEKDGEESPTPGASTPVIEGEDEPTDLPTLTKALEDPTPLADRTEA